MDTNTQTLLYGKPLTECTREELIAGIEYLGSEMKRLREENRRMFGFVDMRAYLLANRGREDGRT